MCSLLLFSLFCMFLCVFLLWGGSQLVVCTSVFVFVSSNIVWYKNYYQMPSVCTLWAWASEMFISEKNSLVLRERRSSQFSKWQAGHWCTCCVINPGHISWFCSNCVGKECEGEMGVAQVMSWIYGALCVQWSGSKVGGTLTAAGNCCRI